MPDHQDLIHLIAGGAGGTAGAILTCPLEVVKTRLQSSVSTFRPIHMPSLVPVTQVASMSTCASSHTTTVTHSRASFSSPINVVKHAHVHRQSAGILQCLKVIVENEGAKALFKGLGPNLVGVAPSRAIYFCAYASAKKRLNNNPNFRSESPLVHLCSAFCAGFSACTLTNPVWFVKTRLQLDQKRNQTLSVKQCVKQVYNKYGVLGFYKGITASYFGICETIIHFVIYEAIKARLLDWNLKDPQDRHPLDFFELMFAGAVSKTCASILAYPHEVARTRLREEGTKYRSFFQTLRTVAHEEGVRALYRGLTTQLVRQIPNTAILMSTYELVVYLLSHNTAEDPV